MEYLHSVSDAYSPWRDADLVPEKTLPKNSDVTPEDQDRRSYTLHVIKEGLTEVGLKLNGFARAENTFTAPRSIFRTYIL